MITGSYDQPAEEAGVSLMAAQALVRHLKENPGEVINHQQLAERFGLHPEIVKDALRTVHKTESAWEDSADILAPLKRGLMWLRIQFRKLTDRPVEFVTMSGALAMGAYALRFTQGKTYDLPVYLFISFVLVAHVLCYYRTAQTRVALYGALALWLIGSTWSVIALGSRPETKQDTFGLVGLVFASLFFALAYALLAVLSAVAGGYIRVKDESRRESQMSRQEVIERVYALREMLKKSRLKVLKTPTSSLPQEWTSQFDSHPWLHTATAGMAISLIGVAILHLTNANLEHPLQNTNVANIALLSWQLLTIISTFAIAYLGGNFRRSLMLAIWFRVWSAVPEFLPIAPFGPHMVSYFVSPQRLIFNGVLVSIATILGSMGAEVERRAMLGRLMREQDPAVLLGELVRLELRLSENAREVCVVVVDAVKSAEMKAHADALDAEYSFREYQKMISKIAHLNGGSVHSTAGDGAVLAFDDCTSAFRAAREIQTEISTFNETVNRMQTKFRLRVGLHMGHVAGELNEVQFTQVIDIAAHVQAIAPIRGICMTAEVAQYLPGETLIPLKDQVDSHDVLLAYNPTADEV